MGNLFSSSHILKFALSMAFFMAIPFGYAQFAAPAPIPPSIATAKTVFLANAGEEDYEHCANTYNRLYANLKSWGKYQLVSDPAMADLIFEMHYTETTYVTDRSPNSVKGKIRLIIFDQKTHFVLWSATEMVDGALFQKNFDKNVDASAAGIVEDLKMIALPGATASIKSPADSTTPKTSKSGSKKTRLSQEKK